MPMVPNLRASVSLLSLNDNVNDDSGCPTLNLNSSNAEDFPLLLPLPLQIYNVGACNQKMLEMEWSLQHMQANDALNECHSHIRVRRQLYQYKTQHVRGQGWEQKLQPLKKAHLRPIGDFGGQTQGTAIMSWIWLTHGISTNDNKGLQDSLCVELCKAHARHNRWSEEIHLLLEEMQHVLKFLDWQAEQWDSRGSSDMQPNEEEGFIAYACRQAHTRRRLAAIFKESWRKVPDLVASGLNNNLLVEEDDGPSLNELHCENIDDA
ncbi:hypothetical protein DEU56DRAFT_752886 [Suillus clintonianus]|uniref:uncharacterized protein n=1 Tax=Suillus clintonianus TaxID=1904413 RepID=UPI001B87560B|nr:uncharacterized protein DEU56DRAFT_752886 [Suillus clintonianus]KAG2149234.1 hypothetical protein DEU56DRAFT_752886 [Suillus clintonianus]